MLGLKGAAKAVPAKAEMESRGRTNLVNMMTTEGLVDEIGRVDASSKESPQRIKGSKNEKSARRRPGQRKSKAREKERIDVSKHGFVLFK